MPTSRDLDAELDTRLQRFAASGIRAETAFGVIISNVTRGSEYGQIHITSRSYILVDGIFVTGGTSPKFNIGLYGASDHIKITRCGSAGAGGSTSSFMIASGTYNLIQDCFAYGCGRYPFGVFGGQYNIFIRCLVRWDYADTYEPQAAFANYGGSDVGWQNCIAIDGLDIDRRNPIGGDPSCTWDKTYRGIAGFKTPNGSPSTSIKGCIVLNFEGPAVMYEKNGANLIYNHNIEDLIAWDLPENDVTATYKPSAAISVGNEGTGRELPASTEPYSFPKDMVARAQQAEHPRDRG